MKKFEKISLSSADRAELLGCLIDVVEDWLEERNGSDEAIIYGEDYSVLSDGFASVLGIQETEEVTVYYTFGTDPAFPFYGGWVEVTAPNMKEAHALFRKHFPDRVPGILNCSDYYTEEQFKKTGMTSGNFGSSCHKKITFISQNT